MKAVKTLLCPFCLFWCLTTQQQRICEYRFVVLWRIGKPTVLRPPDDGWALVTVGRLSRKGAAPAMIQLFLVNIQSHF